LIRRKIRKEGVSAKGRKGERKNATGNKQQATGYKEQGTRNRRASYEESVRCKQKLVHFLSESGFTGL
jgi:hypothetical protein